MAKSDAAPIWSEPLWVDTTSISTSHPYTVVDLCCGCGGFTLGFQAAGYLPLLGIESVHWPAETFRTNFPGVPLLESAVEKLTDDAIVDAVCGRDVDVICAGLPCPGFSTNGGQRAEDARNWLFTQLARVVELLMPHAVAIENVPPIGTVHDGAFGRWLSAALADAGLGSVSLEILNAADYGVPQNRKRAIVIATPCGQTPYPAPILAEPFHRSVDAAIGDLRRLPQGALPNHDWPVPGAELQARISALSHGEPLNARFTGGCRRLWPDRPGFTTMGNHGQPHIHPSEDRFLSVREMARLQGFPDTFTLEGSVRRQQDQVANAIPPPLAEHVALALRPLLDAVSERASEVETDTAVTGRRDHDLVGTDRPRSPGASVLPRTQTDDAEGATTPVLVPVESHHHVRHPGLPVSAIIEGDNLDALNALLPTHAGLVDAIFVDPPYNTGTTESYRNSFGDAEWVQSVAERLRLARELLTADGTICVTIDHVQLFNLGSVADAIFGRRNRLGVVTVVHNERGRSGFDGNGFNENHETYLFYARQDDLAEVNPVRVPDGELRSRFPHEDEHGRLAWHGLTRTGGNSRPHQTPKQYYPIYADPVSGHMGLTPFACAVEILPVDAEGHPRTWSCIPATFEDWLAEGLLRLAPSRHHPSGHTIQKLSRPNGDDGLSATEQPKTVWLGPDLNAATHGTGLLRRMIGLNPFSYPKSVHAVKRALHAMVGHKPDATVLDPYAGSGTTAHALLMLNAEDGGRRRFILVNSNEITKGRGGDRRRICEEICLPRVRAAIEGYGYRSGGRTVRVPGLPGNFRYHRVEVGPTDG